MKKVLMFSAVIAASLIATKSYSQVYVNAHVGLRVPGVRVYAAPVYQQPVYQQPVYQEPAYQQPVYQDPAYDQAPAYGGYYAAPSVCETDYPGYAYYDYPAWYGHYRDRVYFSHYRPFFERDHRAYFSGGRFDHGRWGRERGSWGHERGGRDRGHGNGHGRW
jgi:hypothetical protein